MSSNTSAEEVWAGIERSYKLSREYNRQTLRDHVGVVTATVLAFSNQRLHTSLLGVGPTIEGVGSTIEFVDPEDEGPKPNPLPPVTP